MNALRRRLSRRLAEVGLDVAPEEIYPATGWYRTAPQADVYRWTAFTRGRGQFLCSYDTMSDCARYGVVDDGHEISAKKGLVPSRQTTWEVEAVPVPCTECGERGQIALREHGGDGRCTGCGAQVEGRCPNEGQITSYVPCHRCCGGMVFRVVVYGDGLEIATFDAESGPTLAARVGEGGLLTADEVVRLRAQIGRVTGGGS